MRKALLALGLLLLAAAGWFVYKNASIERLRAEFRPWMARLERWRDANEAVRRALRSRDATAADPDGIADLRRWAWNGVDRLGYVDYRVEKPAHDGEHTTGRVTFTVGAFRGGARIERSASATVREAGGRYSVRFDEPLESPSFVWISFRGAGFEPFTPPAAGREVEIPFEARALSRPPDSIELRHDRHRDGPKRAP